MRKADVELVEADNAVALETRIVQGMDVDAENETGWTLLHVAVWQNSVKCVRVLVQKGADVNKENMWNMTPIHFAAECGYTECLKVLVDAKANLDAWDDDAGTPLHYAAWDGHKACVQILLVARAQLDIENHGGHSALDIAIERDQHECAELLFHAGAKISNVRIFPIPNWMNDIVTKHNNFKASFTVLYGILRRRLDVPFLFNPVSTNVPPVVNIICSMLTDTRYHTSWNICDTSGKKAKY